MERPQCSLLEFILESMLEVAIGELLNQDRFCNLLFHMLWVERRKTKRKQMHNMRFPAGWLARHDERFAKLKLRKRQIATELQRQIGPPNRMVSNITNVQTQVLQVPSTTIITKNKHKFKVDNRKWRPRNLLPFGINYETSFQEAISPVLLLAQIFALMPIRGITSKSARDLMFSWRHVRSFYSLFVLFCFGCYCGVTIADVIYGIYSFDAAETIIFSSWTFLISGAFYGLARKWPILIVEWESTEMKLLTLLRGNEKVRLAVRIKIIMFVTTLCSLVEHVLSMASMFHYINRCPVLPGHPVDSFLMMTSNQFFRFFEYSTIAGVMGKLLNILTTFTWNFNDIFIMSVSMGLSTRFHQLNEYMLKSAKRSTSVEFWIQCRLNYQNLCKLCDSIDNTISWTVLLCFSNNLYFICSKILKSLQKKPSLMHTMYFWFSLFYLLGRTLTLSIFTSNINEESKRPLSIFRIVPHKFWCSELKRFSIEVANGEVALSGLKFFRLTRSVVLSVAGTIVTYELVLLQFNKEDRIQDC